MRHPRFFQISLPPAEPEERRAISRMRRNEEIVCEVGDLPFGLTDTNVQDVMIIPAAAAVMTAKVAQPK
jgi:hypothetical protein